MSFLIIDFNSQHLSNTLLALATLDHVDDKLTNDICVVSIKNLDMSHPQNICNTLYALVVSSSHSHKHGEALLKKLFELAGSALLPNDDHVVTHHFVGLC